MSQESALEPSQPWFADTFDLSVEELDALPVGVITLDRGGTVVRYNRTEAAYARRAVEQTLGKNFFLEIAPCTRVREFEGRFRTFAAGTGSGYERFDFSFPFRWGRRDVDVLLCRKHDVETIDIIVTSKDRAVLTLDPPAVQNETADASFEPEETVRLLPQGAVWFDDLQRPASLWSRALYDLCELDPDRTPSAGGPRAFAHPADIDKLDAFVRAAIGSRVPYAIEHRIVTTSGTIRFVETRASMTHDELGRVTSIHGTVVDVTERRTAERELWLAAHRDRLTKVANRHHLEKRVQAALDDTSNIGRELAVVFIDLNRFKAVNDTFGHVVGDQLLCEIATKLSRCVRPQDVVARLSGDEFVVLVAGFDDFAIVESICANVLGIFAEPIAVGGRFLSVTASLGVSSFPRHGSTVEELLNAADCAMYDGKESHTTNVVHYSAKLRREIHRRAILEHELSHALANGELELYYQPIVDRHTKRIVAAEALVRWRHPTRGIVAPGEFIGVAEANGAILPIGVWVLREACAHIARAADRGLSPIPISVNVSLAQFRSSTLVGSVREVLDAAKISPGLVTLELTESIASGDFHETMRTLVELKMLGVSLAIDDFGTGYSSLAYLKHFPIDTLKLDRAFCAEIAVDPLDRAIAEAVIVLAQKLRLDVVAEGVETDEQAAVMETIGCDRLQGFRFGAPCSETAFFETRARDDASAYRQGSGRPAASAMRVPSGGLLEK